MNFTAIGDGTKETNKEASSTSKRHYKFDWAANG